MLCSKCDIVAVIDISYGNFSAGRFSLDEGKTRFSGEGEYKSCVIFESGGHDYKYFLTLSAQTVRRRLKQDGFIFI